VLRLPELRVLHRLRLSPRRLLVSLARGLRQRGMCARLSTQGAGRGYVCDARPPRTMSDWRQRITVSPGQCGGRPCIRGMRVRVSDVLDLLAEGLSRDEVLSELPYLEAEDIEAALRYASEHVQT